MQTSIQPTSTYPNPDPAIDPMTLARLDVGLFRTLLGIGTSRQQICSTLCLSHTEYDYIARLLQCSE
jgi:hypothetical protein